MTSFEDCTIPPQESLAITNFPTSLAADAFLLSDDQKELLIKEKFKEILEVLGLDLNDKSLQETPGRMARMYVREIFSGLNPANFPSIKVYHNPQASPNHEVLYVKNISLISFCEHHLIPMSGFAHVAYIPHEKLIGLSKIIEIVRYFSKRPQLQERLTAQIVDCLSMILNTPDIACAITVQHFCIAARGVEDRHSQTTTHLCKGQFESDFQKRMEFFQNIPK